MVYLNGKFIAKKDANISVMDRGFLFADSVYEVIPVYNSHIFRLKQHLERLARSLNALSIDNPYNFENWHNILLKLITQQDSANLSIYIQVTRGCDIDRKHISNKNLVPTVFAYAQNLSIPSIESLTSTNKVNITKDIRWSRCDIKSTALLANVLALQQAQEKDIKEVILLRNNTITEGASSNVFIIKNNIVFTHPENNYILSGITRSVVIEAIKRCNIEIVELAVSKSFLLDADEVWISSSTKEIMPITYIDNKAINNGKIGKLWYQIYNEFIAIKNTAYE